MNDLANTLEPIYTEPELGLNQSDCYFYHRMQLPGVGWVGTHWDIDADCENYLGQVDFRGKRVLDVGAGAGFLSFEMERRGAEVVSFDMADSSHWEMVPYASTAHRREEEIENRRRSHRRLRNAYWFAHEKLQSKAKVFLGNVYDLPLELGTFDVVFFGMILGHLQNPFQALYSASRLCKESMVVANQTLQNKKTKRSPFAHFMPSVTNAAADCWWALSDNCVSTMLEILGFESERQINSNPKCNFQDRVGNELCTTTVAKRTVGQPETVLTEAA